MLHPGRATPVPRLLVLVALLLATPLAGADPAPAQDQLDATRGTLDAATGAVDDSGRLGDDLWGTVEDAVELARLTRDMLRECVRRPDACTYG